MKPRKRTAARVRVGDAISAALSAVGITPERFSGWLGRPCRCRRTHAKLNVLTEWAARVARGEAQPGDLEAMTGQELDRLAEEKVEAAKAAARKKGGRA